MSKTIPDIHQWLHDGPRVFIVKVVENDGKSHGGFQWPLTVGAEVKPEKWSREPTCDSGGLFGWPWGFGVGEGKEPNANKTWIVFSALPKNVIGNIKMGWKCKVVPLDDECAKVEYVGTQGGAMAFTILGRVGWIEAKSKGSSSATGHAGSSSATGDAGSSSATGDKSIAITTGEYSTIECKNGIAASTANRVTWIWRPLSILIIRWRDQKDNTLFPFRLFVTFRVPKNQWIVGLKDREDGEQIKIEYGKVVKDWSSD